MTAVSEDEEWGELTSAQFNRVDLVHKGANGFRGFLVAKEDAAGLMDPAYVRDLIAKADPEPEPEAGNVTMTGSPGAIAAFIHKAAQDRAAGVAKAKNDTADRKHKAATGAAMPDGSYPIADVGDLHKAIRAVGRGGSSHNAIRKHIISRARSLGASSEIPDNWNSDGSLKGDSVSKSDGVAKADIGPDLDDGVDGMDPTVPLAAPEDDAPGDPTDPGSPAWEAIDAATASKWCSILSRARVAIDLLSEREMLEAASADPDDAGNACDLQDVCCAIDYAISVLAPFAVAEQSEADCGEADLMAAIGKAAAGVEEPLGLIEPLAAVAKAGRVLSASNEARIREAAASLNAVLQTLPQAPVAGDPVTKEEAAMTAAQTQDQAAPESSEPVTKAGDAPVPSEPQEPAEVAKADGEDGKPKAVAVYDAKGNLVGIVDPGDITPVEGADAPASNEPEPEAKAAEAEATADPGDMTPQPPADAGTPADDVAKEDVNDQDEREVLKSIVSEAVSALLDSRTPAEDIAKQADVAGLLEEVRVLKERLATVEATPAAPKVFTNGAVPPPGALRGQDRAAAGQPRVDIAKAAELKGVLYHGTAAEQNQAAKDMNLMAIDALAAIHGRS